MNKFFCRIYQKIMKFAMHFLPWREPILLEGENSVCEIPEIFRSKGIDSVLLVSDKGITSKGLHESTLKAFKQTGIKCTVYDETIPNPTIDNIEEGLNLYHKNNCKGIVAIGGGSPMDCAKGIGARVGNPNKTIAEMRGILKVRRKMPTFVAVPTTAGTGSETTLAAVITDSTTHEKYALNDPDLIPNYAILDPTLTLSLPPFYTATTGLDALTHAIEAYIGNSNTKKTKKCAEEATKLIFENLIKAYENGSDIVARENMQRASFLAGVAFTRAYVGNVHAIAHTLGGEYQTPHGLANAIILPYVLEYYGSSIYKKIFKLCEKCGFFPETKSPKEKTEKFIESIKKLNSHFELGNKIQSLKKEDIPKLVKRAMKEANPLYPVPKIFDFKYFENIYEKLLA